MPEGTILPLPFAGEIVNAAPEQIVVVCAITLGIGFTVTVAIKVAPVQFIPIGVTV